MKNLYSKSLTQWIWICLPFISPPPFCGAKCHPPYVKPEHSCCFGTVGRVIIINFFNKGISNDKTFTPCWSLSVIVAVERHRGDIPFATSNEIYPLNVYGCHANIMTYLLPYRCMIFIHMAFWVGVNRRGRRDAIMKWNKLGMLIIKEIGENGERDTMEEAFIHCFYLVPCYYIRSIKTPLMHTSIWTAFLTPSPSLSLLLIRNYERKTKKSDSSFCRGPLMISLKWLTALNSIGNLPQSKQIWSVLETEPGAWLGEGLQHECVHVCEVGKRGGGC